MAKSPARVANPSPWMTRQQLGDYIQVDVQTVDNMAADGRLKAHRLGRIVRFHHDEVDAALGLRA